MEEITLNLPQMLNERQAAHILAVSIAALRRWRREGRGPRFTHVERCIRYDLRAIEIFLTENSSGNNRAIEPRVEPERNQDASEPR